MPNYGPLSAIEITALPYEFAVDLSASPDDSVNVPDGCVNNPARNPGWWKYTAHANDVAISITASYQGIEAGYVPLVAIWIDDPANPGTLTQTIVIDGAAINQVTVRVIPGDFSGGYIGVWLMVPVVAGQVYYIQNLDDSDPYVAPTDTITLTVRRAPRSAVPAGSLLIPDDSAPYPSLAMSPDGAVLRAFADIQATDKGDTLSTGEICCASDDGLRVYSSQAALIATITLLPTSGASVVRAHPSGKWYVGCKVVASTALTIITVNPDGTLGPDTWTLVAAAAGALSDLAIDPDETIAYWVGSSGAGPSDLTKIRRHDLVTDLPLSDLVDLGPGNSFASNGDMACVESDGSVLVRSDGAGSSEIRRYSAAGAITQTYSPDGGGYHLDRFRQEPDGVTLWVWMHDADAETSYLQQIRVSSGAVLHTSAVFALDNASGRGRDINFPFAPSDSCPLLFLVEDINVAVSYEICRLRRAPHIAVERKRNYHQRFELDMETGLGTSDDPDIAPNMRLRWSDDGGHTWSSYYAMSAGAFGAYGTRMFKNRLGSARDRVYEVSTCDDAAWRLLAAYIKLTPGTR